ncbi:hypothetical protein [Streptomyces sp. NPDC047108]|uniref:hypothetical protein n=1 Tax=Streptomyces sp. NPDC047108 TaxID=3155025 RepID=UPI003404E175
MTLLGGYLCPRCQDGSYEDWLLGVTRRATELGDLSTALWGMRFCTAGHPYTELFGAPGARNTAPYVVERCTMEAAYLAQYGETPAAGVITPIRLDATAPPKRSAMYLDALTWMGLAVASGVLGNAAYSGIKAVVNRFRERPEPNPLHGLSEAEVQRCLEVMHEYLAQRLADLRVTDDGDS